MSAQPQDAVAATLPEIFETCIGCGICREFCPVFDDLFALARERSEGRAPLDAIGQRAEALAGNCYFCGRCESACPIDLPLEQLAWESLRARHESAGVLRALKWSSDVDRLARWRGRLGWFLALLGSLGRKILQKLTGIDARAPLPPRGKPRLARWWKKHLKVQGVEGAPRVAVFAGCQASSCDGGPARALIETLERSGCEVQLLAHESCCGAPEFAAARADAAAGKLGAVIAQLERAAESGREVVMLESACVKMIRRDGRHVFEDTKRLKKLRVHAAAEYLWKLHEAGTLARPARALEGTIAWHEGCVDAALGAQHESLRLLRQVPGLEVKRLDSACCGMGGAWGMRVENFERAQSFCEQGVGKVLAESGAQTLASECAQCRLQLGGKAERARSVIEIYRESLDPAGADGADR